MSLKMGRRRGFTLVELLVVIAVIGVLVGLLLPAVQAARESARRAQCLNQIKQISLALLQYDEQNKVLPPGTIMSPGAYYTASPLSADPWAQATSTAGTPAGAGLHATSWMLRILPFIEMGTLYDKWSFSTNVEGNQTTAAYDVKAFYCPTRRSSVRPGQDDSMFKKSDGTYMYGGTIIYAGGSDYGGCAGRVVGWSAADVTVGSSTLPGADHPFVDASIPTAAVGSVAATPTSDPLFKSFYQNCGSNPIPIEKDSASRRMGIFFRPNIGTTLAAIRDGQSNTLMVGELQRITQVTPIPGKTTPIGPSHDGWAVGSDSVLFSTAVANPPATTDTPPKYGPLMNNGDFRSPGSDHISGANFGLADGSMKFLSNSIDPDILALLGSMVDTIPVQAPE
jgi:prepilin-type N-terminal cleavage/methylation domain-containing protein